MKTERTITIKLADYLHRAKDEAKRKTLKEQWNDACEYDTIKCGCGRARHLTKAYRCWYCGEWYCPTCAAIHFLFHCADAK